MNTVTRIALPAVLAFVLVACGGSDQASSGRIGTSGGTLTTAGGARLDIPAGALSREGEVHLREVEPGNGAAVRVEVELPEALRLAARLSVRTEDSANHKLVRLENEVEHGIETERHNELEHSREAAVKSGGTFQLRHSAVCSVACGDGLECDDGLCKPHGDAAGGVAPNLDGTCPVGMELDDGLCKLHGGAVGGTPPVSGACPDGMELDASDGVCKPHGGGN